MLHSHVKVWVHVIWNTLKKKRVLTRDLRVKLFHHLMERAAEEGIQTVRINVQPEHVHCLLCLPSDKTLAAVVKTLKGESSRWINEQALVPGRFRWQRGYGAFSVSASQVERVKRYIENQDEHHKRVSFQEEYADWARRYGLDLEENR